MLRPLILTFLFASSFVLTPTLSAQSSSNSDPCPCTLRGAVVDSVSGNPIHGALVKAMGNSTRAALTDAEGKFQFESLPAGALTLTTAKPGYLGNGPLSSGNIKTSTIEIGAATPALSIPLVPEGVVFGKITNENGEPLESVSLILLRRSQARISLPNGSQLQATTDDEGNFRFANLPRGSYYLLVHETQVPAPASLKDSVIPEGFAPAFFPGVADLSSAVPIKVAPGKSFQADFSLKRERFIRLSGTVSGYTSNPGAGQQVQLTVITSAGAPIPTEIRFDASTGTFQSGWIPPGSYTLGAAERFAFVDSFPPAFLVATVPINAKSDVSNIHLALQRVVSIPLEIRGDVPSVITPAISGWLNPKDATKAFGIQASWIPRDSKSPENGSLAFPVVLPGTYSVELTSNSSNYIESAVCGSTDLFRGDLVVSPGFNTPIEVTMREGAATINGLVLSEGHPAPAAVFLFSSISKQRPKMTTTDARGAFTFSGLAPGTYRVVALENSESFDENDPGFLSKLSSNVQEVTLVPKQTASIQLELAKVDE